MTSETRDLGGHGERPTYDYIVIGAGPAGCAVAAASRAVVDRDDRRPRRGRAGQGVDAFRHSARDRRARATAFTAQLRLRDHAASGVRRAQGLSTTRARARRQQPHQCDGLHAGPAAGLRRMGRARVQGLGLGGRPSLLQALGGQRARRGRVAWRRRTASRQRSQLPQSGGRSLRRGRSPGGIPAQCGFQWRRARGRRAPIRCFRRMAVDTTPQGRICNLRPPRTSRSFPKPRRAASCSRADRRSASSLVAPEPSNGLTRGGRSSSAAAPSDRRSSSWSRGSGRLSISSSFGIDIVARCARGRSEPSRSLQLRRQSARQRAGTVRFDDSGAASKRGRSLRISAASAADC